MHKTKDDNNSRNILYMNIIYIISGVGVRVRITISGWIVCGSQRVVANAFCSFT